MIIRGGLYMIEYASEAVIKLLKQYEMLLKSLKFTTDLKQKQEISLQMTRIIQRVLNITNGIYEEKYSKVLNRNTFLMDEEKNRLLELINLINERRVYVNNQLDNNYEYTGISVETDDILGEDRLDEYKEQVKIIEKYKNNIKLDGVLKDEIVSLDASIKKANDKISSNKVLNKQLELKMINILDKAFQRLSLYELRERDKEIDLAYTELGYSLEKAKENAKIARRDCSSDVILECDNMLASITLEYERYKEKKLILRLLDIYKDPVSNYDELLSKREEINSILNGIVSSDLYLEVGEELNKEYATIKLEMQDVTTLKSLIEEKNNKVATLEKINYENNSEEFKGMLSNLLENEKKYQEKLLLEKKKKEEEQRALELELEKRRKEEMLKRQKLLEEERKKEIEERTKQLLVEKKKPILFQNKESKNSVSRENKSSVTMNVSNNRTNLFQNRGSKNSISRENKSSVAMNDSNNRKKSIVNDGMTFANTTDTRISSDLYRRKSEKVDQGIPVIRNSNFKNDFIEKKKVDKQEEVFPKIKLEKREDIFSDFPDINKGSFFDKKEFDDLNDAVDGSSGKWF